jgi:hypothetical protein
LLEEAARGQLIPATSSVTMPSVLNLSFLATAFIFASIAAKKQIQLEDATGPKSNKAQTESEITDRSGGSFDSRQSGSGTNNDILAPLVLLAPLAGLAALYTAAAINSNSALITIAVMNTGRKKKSIDFSPQFGFMTSNKLNVTDVSYEIMSSLLKYHGIRSNPCFAAFGCQIAYVQNQPFSETQSSMKALVDQLIKNPYIQEEEKTMLLQGLDSSEQDCSRIVCK